MDNNKIAAEAMEYIAYGWHIVPLHGIKDGKCTCRKDGGCGGSAGKHPIHANWRNNCITTEDELLATLDRHPHMNIGVLLGPESGIMDIEFDTPEGKKTADRLLEGMITPTYVSGKSTHRLYKFDPDLVVGKGRLDWQGLEIRTGGEGNSIQSVFPPSMHHSGKQYKWLRGLGHSDCEPIDLPDHVVAQLINNPDGEVFTEVNRPKASKIVTEVVTEGARNDKLFRFACSQAGAYGAKCSEPEQFADIVNVVRSINLTQCDPPMTTDEVDTIVRSAVDMELRSLSAKLTVDQERDTERTASKWGLEWDKPKKEYWPGSWTLAVVAKDPPDYQLTVPAWEKLTGGKPITIDAETYHAPEKMARAILSATKCIIVDEKPGSWTAIWNGGKVKIADETYHRVGLKAKLCRVCTFIEGSPVDIKNITISEYVSLKLAVAKPNPTADDDSPRPQAPHGTLREDGTIWFVWEKFFEDGLITRRFSRKELTTWRRDVLSLKGAEGFTKYPANGSGRQRYFVINSTLKEKIHGFLDSKTEKE